LTAPHYFDHPRPQMRAFVPASARTILDVGCGAGAFATGLREERRRGGHELEIWGLELEPAAAAAAAGVLERVLQGPAEELVGRLPEAHFDCICCNDVLEHLAWPDRVLRDLRRVLKPGGVVVASIPNVRSFGNVWDLVVRGAWSYTDEGILDRTHLRFYTRASMGELFAAAGYRVLRQEGINPTRSWRFRVVNALTLGRWREMRYLQFACVAAPESEVAP
jgi:2-polyprenyl-3-methyl-5-hydroxy-6-metoxy-1,4-benzoquinol methylase